MASQKIFIHLLLYSWTIVDVLAKCWDKSKHNRYSIVIDNNHARLSLFHLYIYIYIRTCLVILIFHLKISLANMFNSSRIRTHVSFGHYKNSGSLLSNMSFYIIRIYFNVSIVLQNFHDKTACEAILQRESPHYLQSYPGSIISGNVRDQSEPLCKHCSVPRLPHPERSLSKSDLTSPSPFWKRLHESRRKNFADGTVQCAEEVNMNSEDKLSHSEAVTECADEVSINQKGLNSIKIVKPELTCEEKNHLLNSSSSSLGTFTEESVTEEEPRDTVDLSRESSAVITDRTSESGCNSEPREDNFLRSHSFAKPSSPRVEREIQTRKWSVEDGGRKSAVVSGIISHSCLPEPPPTHNYQVGRNHFPRRREVRFSRLLAFF